MATKVEQTPDDILYPDSDGQPMAENTLQFRWIVTLQGNLDAMYRDDANVFVAGDLLWYAQEGDPGERMAPDALVVFGRPKGYRGSYMQWKEAGIAPQVVFEVLSPGNRREEMDRKFAFYDRHGVEEYYIYDPDFVRLEGWRRSEGRLRPVSQINGYVSPRLGIRFDLSGEELVVFRPDGSKFLTFLELNDEFERAARERQSALQEAAAASEQAIRYRRETEEARRQVAEAHEREASSQAKSEAATQRAEQLAARLRALGIDPDTEAPAS
jgi:Uma2 family endonuclease